MFANVRVRAGGLNLGSGKVYALSFPLCIIHCTLYNTLDATHYTLNTIPYTLYTLPPPLHTRHSTFLLSSIP